MEVDIEDHLLGAKKRLDLVCGDLNLKTISGRLVKALQKDPKKCDLLSESALILVQSLPSKSCDLIDNEKLDSAGKYRLLKCDHKALPFAF